jgi:hypothetical protein
MRRGDARSMNRWLRVRVLAQGVTIAAICAGSVTFATHKPPTNAEVLARAEERRTEDRKDFAERMKEAEDAEREEARFRPPSAPAPMEAPVSARTVPKRKTYANKTAAAPAEAPASAGTPQTDAPQKTGSSWAGWFGFGRGPDEGKKG